MTRFRSAALITAGIVLAFLIGFGWQYTRAVGYRGQLDQTQQSLTFQRLEATLGAATVEAQRGSYEPSRQLASDFFTGLQQDIGSAPASSTAALNSILSQRDAVITGLSRGDSQSGNVLADLFEQYRAALGQPLPQAPSTPESSTATPD